MCLPYHRMQLLILYRTRPGNFLNSFYFVQYAASTEPTRRSSRVEWMNQGMNEWMHQSKRVYTWVSPCAKCHTEWIQLSWSTLSSFTQSFICVMMYNSVDRLLSLSLSLMCVCVCVCVKDQLTWSSSAIVIHHSCKPLYRSETLPLSFIHSFIRSFIHASKYRMHNPPSEQTWVLSCWSSSAIVIHHSCKPHLHRSIHSFIHFHSCIEMSICAVHRQNNHECLCNMLLSLSGMNEGSEWMNEWMNASIKTCLHMVSPYAKCHTEWIQLMVDAQLIHSIVHLRNDV